MQSAVRKIHKFLTALLLERAQIIKSIQQELSPPVFSQNLICRLRCNLVYVAHKGKRPQTFLAKVLRCFYLQFVG